MKLVADQSPAKRYLLMLSGGLVLIAAVYVPAHYGVFDGENSQWNGVLLWLFVAVPGFILGLVGLVGAIAELITRSVLKLKAKR